MRELQNKHNQRVIQLTSELDIKEKKRHVQMKIYKRVKNLLSACRRNLEKHKRQSNACSRS